MSAHDVLCMVDSTEPLCICYRLKLAREQAQAEEQKKLEVLLGNSYNAGWRAAMEAERERIALACEAKADRLTRESGATDYENRRVAMATVDVSMAGGLYFAARIARAAEADQ